PSKSHVLFRPAHCRTCARWAWPLTQICCYAHLLQTKHDPQRNETFDFPATNGRRLQPCRLHIVRRRRLHHPPYKLDGAPHHTYFKLRVGVIPEPREALWLSNPLLALCAGRGPMVPQTPPSHCRNDDILPPPSPAQPLGSDCRNDK